jgi:hypothetical protein
MEELERRLIAAMRESPGASVVELARVTGGRALDDADGLAPLFLPDLLSMPKADLPEIPHFLPWVGDRVVRRTLRDADGEISINQPPRLAEHLLGHYDCHVELPRRLSGGTTLTDSQQAKRAYVSDSVRVVGGHGGA